MVAGVQFMNMIAGLQSPLLRQRGCLLLAFFLYMGLDSDDLLLHMGLAGNNLLLHMGLASDDFLLHNIERTLLLCLEEQRKRRKEIKTYCLIHYMCSVSWLDLTP